MEYVGQRLESGEFDLEDTARLSDFLTGALAATPQIALFTIINDDLQAIRITQDPVTRATRVDTFDRSNEPLVIAVDRQMRAERSTLWGELIFWPELNATFINVRRPLRVSGEYKGLLTAAVTMRELSQLTIDLGKVYGTTPFILYGTDKVIAHATLLNGHPDQSVVTPAIALSRVNDPVLSKLPLGVPTDLFEIPQDSNADVVMLDVEGEAFLSMSQGLEGYSDKVFTIGMYRKLSEISAPLQMLQLSGIIGLTFLVIAIVGAVLLSRMIARPIQRVSAGATQIGQLNFSDVNDLPQSRIREVDELANSFNKMLSGLKSFETYVPRKLVQQLIAKGSGTRVESEERELTVMFTDIAGFTSMSEGMTAREVAEFVNEHLTFLAECVEEEGGTIDKYIGDALMAFWGAPDIMDNTAIQACRAAQKMVVKIKAENKIRVDRGKQQIGVRIGIHTGPLVVGNIGAPSRINYTVVGDTVNATQRLESLGKEVDPNAEVIVLISGATKAKLGSDFET